MSQDCEYELEKKKLNKSEKIPGAIIPGIPGGNIKEIRGRFHLTKIAGVPRDAKETHPYKKA